MKRKVFSILSFVLLPMFAVLSVFVLSACGEEHTHAFSNWQIVSAATCTQDGQEQRVCEECGKEETRTIPAAHSWGEWQIDVERTCTVNGQKHRQCEVCSEEEIIEEEAIGHQEVVEPGKPASCTEFGFTEKRFCDVCGQVFQDHTMILKIEHVFGPWIPNEDLQDDVCNSTHSRFCENCEEREDGVCDYETTTKLPTCTEGGYSIHRCKICEFSFEHDQTDPTGHNLSEVYTSAKDNEGNFIHTQTCMNKDCTHIETTICEFDKPVHTDAKCEEMGYDTYSCIKCKQQKIDINEEATGHDYDSWQFSTELSADGKFRHIHHCQNCEKEETELCGEEIDFKAASCDEETGEGHRKVFCPTCQHETENETYDKLDHTWSSYEITGTSEENSHHKRTCQVCNKIDEADCSGWTTSIQDATCTGAEQKTKHCPVCQASYTSEGQQALGHLFEGYEFVGPNDQGINQHKQVCKRPGCQHEEITDCVETEDSRQEASCTQTGLVKSSCKHCFNQVKQVLEKTPHIWVEEDSAEDKNEWVITDNDHTHTCKKCGQQETLEHTFTESNLCSACGYDALVYEVKNGSYAVVRHDRKIDKNPNVKKIIIASSYQGYPVTEIESGLTIDKVNLETGGGWLCGFTNNTYIEEVVLPHTLKVINSYAFSSCQALTNVSVDTSSGDSQLTTIGEYAFYLCSKLQDAHLPGNLLHIGRSAFANCKDLSDISIPSTVEDIGDNAFSNTAFLNNPTKWDDYGVIYINNHLIKAKESLVGEYTIAANTKTITAEAFMNCTGLEKIVLPATLVEVGTDAFKNCTALTCVEFSGTFAQWISVKFANDYASPMAYSNFLDIKGAQGTIEIPVGTTAIPAGAFKGSDIQEITIPASVISIGEEAFENCTSLATINFDEGCKLEYVGTNAFKGTPYYEDKVNNWTNGTFYVGHCLVEASSEIAEDYIVLDGTVSIAPYAFYNNTTIKSIVLPKELVYIGLEAFEGCTELKSAEFKEHTGWMGFNLHGAGRSTTSEIDPTNPETAAKNKERAAYLLTDVYTKYWRRTVKKVQLLK